MTAHLLLVALLTLFLPAKAAELQDPVSKATASVAGQVVGAATGRPLPGALVRLGTSGTIIIQTGETAQTVTRTEGARYMLTDRNGQFLFERVEPGRYVLTTETPGYLISGYQQRDPGSPVPEFEVTDGQHRRDLTIAAWPGSVLTGSVYDETGEPVVGVQVNVLRDEFVYGARKLERQRSVDTDDRGVYRVSGLAPGRYVVAVPSASVTVPAAVIDAYRQAREAGDRTASTSIASFREVYEVVTRGGRNLDGALLVTRNPGLMPAVNGNRLSVYPTTYHPGTTDVGTAVAVDLAAGDERIAVDIHVTLIEAFELEGTLTHPTEDTEGVDLELWPLAAARLARPAGYDVATTRSATGGRFRFAGVPAGSYQLRARKIPRSEQVWEPMTMRMDGREVATTVMRMRLPDVNAVTLWADQSVTVSADTGSIEISLSRGARLSGRARFEGDGAPPSGAALENARVFLTSAEGSSTSAYSGGSFGPDGAFTTLEHEPGRYYVYAFSISGWRLEAATVNGRDALRTPFVLTGSDVTNVELTYSNRPLVLAGLVVGPATPGAPRASHVVAFPADYEKWIDDGMYPLLSATAAAAEDGTFRLRPLASGEYLVAAYEPAGHRNPRDPEFIRELAHSAVAVTVAGGAPVSVMVPTAVVR